MFKKLFLIIVCSFLLTQPLSAEKIFLKSGKIITGPLLEEKEEYLKVNVSDVAITLYRDQIERIEDDNKEGTSITPISTALLTGEEITKKFSPSVVVIKVRRGQKSGLGSGFLVNRKGIIVTNFHVVIGAEAIQVEFKGGRTVAVEGIVAYDAVRDLCVMKIAEGDYPSVELGDSDQLTPGEGVVVIGAPQGVGFVTSEGLYSGRREICRMQTLQFTAPIDPGSSGGPVFNLQGQVIGIATFKRLATTSYNFGIPINEAKGLFHDGLQMNLAEFRSSISKAYDLYHQGQNAYFESHLEDAIALVKQAVELSPDYLEAWIGLGELYLAANQNEEAFKVWKKIVAEDPENVEARINFGIANFYQGYLDEAIVQLERAVQLDPQRVEANDNLGSMYGRKKLYEKAISSHQKAIAINSNYASAHYNLATAYFNTGQYQASIQESDTAASLGYEIPQDFLNMITPYRSANVP